MYLVICEATYECWYEEFVSLDGARMYIDDQDKHTLCRLFKVTEFPVPVKGV